jgi:hypothetical protein
MKASRRIAATCVLCIGASIAAAAQPWVELHGSAAVPPSAMHRKAKHVLFTFARSGGFAGAATAIRASVSLQRNGGSVSAPERAGYHHNLTAEESAQVRERIKKV